ncbi:MULTISPECIES: hypothetical protein [unclassified Streptomyces]|uniref:hypothetical protein n=1 Tax=unclassified Streptomyces TaxID=2593676 RepID=UPI0021566D6A|nr:MULTISPECIES: hypothetical protein [unclassified Streptomyces]
MEQHAAVSMAAGETPTGRGRRRRAPADGAPPAGLPAQDPVAHPQQLGIAQLPAQGEMHGPLPAPYGPQEQHPGGEPAGGGRRRRAAAAAEEQLPESGHQQIPNQAAGEQPSGRRRRAAPDGVPEGVNGPDTGAGPSGGIVMPPADQLPPPPQGETPAAGNAYANAPALAGVRQDVAAPGPGGAAPALPGPGGAQPQEQPQPQQIQHQLPAAPQDHQDHQDHQAQQGQALPQQGDGTQFPDPSAGQPGVPGQVGAPGQPGAPVQPGVPGPGFVAEAGQGGPGATVPSEATPGVPQEHEPAADPEQAPQVEHPKVAASPILNGSLPQPERPRQPQALPMPGSDRGSDRHSPGVSVRTLGQGIPVSQLTQHAEQRAAAERAAVEQQAPAGALPAALPVSSPGRRRKLANPAADDARLGAAASPASAPGTTHPAAGNSDGGGRQFTIGAPAEGAEEGPEHLDGPGGAVEVTGTTAVAGPVSADEDELPPEPLDNPRRLLVWPEPDVSTQQALTDRGYRPVLVQSRQEVDAQIAAYPAALFVDPLTGPITRTALQSLRQAAVAAGVPVLVTAGLGQASRDAAYGADPAVLLKALAPRDSEQHPPRVLLVEERQPIADALSMALERRGMQVVHASSDSDAMEQAQHLRPNLVVMDLGQVRRRRAGIIDWLRVNDLLARTPFVVYTAADLDPARLPQLASGETVLFLAERSTSAEVQSRIVDLLAKIGAGSMHG